MFNSLFLQLLQIMLHLPPEKSVEYHFHCCLSTSFLWKTAHFCSGLSREGSVVAMVALIGAGVAASLPFQECGMGVNVGYVGRI